MNDTRTTTETAAPRFDPITGALETYRAMTTLQAAASSGLDERTAQLMCLRASQINNCAFCTALHTRAARVAGETGERLADLAAWHGSTRFDARERAGLALTEAMTRLPRDGVPDAVYDAAAAAFDPPQLARLVWLLAVVNAWNRVAVAARLAP